MIILVAILAVSIATPALAQTGIGLRLGANLPNVSFTDEDGNSIDEFDSKSNTGFVFGAVLELGVSENFAIQPELLFSQHGFAFDDTFFGEKISVKTRFNYLQLPVLAKAKFGSDAFGFNIVAGPHLGFGIGDITTEAEVLGEKEKESSSWDDAEFKRLDFGVTGGVGISFAAGPGRLGLDARYQLGLGNLISEPEGSEKASNRNMQLSLSYIIPLGQ